MIAVQSPDNVFAALDKIDVLLHGRQYQAALLAYIGLLTTLSRDDRWAGHQRPWRHGGSLVEISEVCERAAGQWQRLLMSSLDPAKIPFNLLVPSLDTLHALLMGTSQGNLDSFIGALHARTGGKYQAADVLRLVLAWCPTSRRGWQPFSLAKALPELVAAQAVATLGAVALVSTEAEAARGAAVELLLSGALPPGVLRKFALPRMLLNAWMRCSYAEHPRKHAVKPWLAEALGAGIGLPATFQLAPPAQVNDKPVLLIPVEVMVRDHAMFRCYSPMVSACRERFHTVGLGIDGLVDDDARALFDDFHLLPSPDGSTEGYARVFRQVQVLLGKIAPAMVWYPSVGMHAAFVGLAQRRLAPVQAMTFGHPASSFSPVMDYALVGEGHQGDAVRFSEQRVVLPRGTERFVASQQDDLVDVAPDLPSDGVIRVAVPSIAPKLSATFLRALAGVQARCGRRVQFVFFLGCTGALYASAVQNLRREVARGEYYPRLSYDEYLRQLRRCHLHAGSYPFGGTNSLIDSLRLGLPVLAWRGPEPHSSIDAEFAGRVGLPAEFVCDSEEQYIARLVALVDDPATILAQRKRLLDGSCARHAFIEQGQPGAFADALVHLLP